MEQILISYTKSEDNFLLAVNSTEGRFTAMDEDEKTIAFVDGLKTLIHDYLED